MSSYIKSELYRILHNRRSYLFIGICSLLLISANVTLSLVKASDSSFKYATTAFSLTTFCTAIVYVYYLCILVSTIVFGSEHNNHTMKNTVSYGISRGTIFVGKLLMQIVYAIIAFAVLLGVYVLSAYLLLENSGQGPLTMLIDVSFACLPLLMFGIGVTNCFLFIFESEGAAIGAACAVMAALPLVTNLLSMKFQLIKNINKFMPINMINSIGYDFDKYSITLPWARNGYQMYWLIGLAEMLLFTVIGYYVFRKKEIK